MTLNDVERQKNFMDLLVIHKVAPRYYRYAIQIDNLIGPICILT